jgi:hypothetical protein
MPSEVTTFVKRIKGKWVEVIADRATHKYSSRAEISFDIRVDRNTFAGTVTARSYDVKGILTDGPTAPGRFEGERVTYPLRVTNTNSPDASLRASRAYRHAGHRLRDGIHLVLSTRSR